MGSGVDACGRMVKLSLVVTNMIMFLGGAIVFCLSIWTLVDKSFINELLGTNMLFGIVYVLIVMSLFVCFFSFVGCIGASKEIKCMLLTYFTIIFLVFVVVLIGGILGYVFREKVRTTTRQEMFTSIKLYGNKRQVTYAWDTTQERLKCCGVDSYRDWYLHGNVPASCCKETYAGQKQPCVGNPTPATVYTQGCLPVASSFIRDHASVIAGCSIALSVLMIFGMVFSCSLFRMIK